MIHGTPVNEDCTAPLAAPDDEVEGGPRVVVAWNGGVVRRALRPGVPLMLGRAPDAGICIDDAAVSRRHAVIRFGSPPRIRDLGSANGTFVMGRRIASDEEVALADGCMVEVGTASVWIWQPPHEAVGPRARDGGAPRDAALRADGIEQIVARVAPSAIPVLILGDTGAGKGVLAERIHKLSPRSARPFVRLNCAAVPEALLESELFGHERGSFTGATQSKPGLLEAANGGTFFLDEIGEMPLWAQAKLLHVLENHEVLRVGAVSARRIDVRFLSATNRDVTAMVADGMLRRDLFFRLNGITMTVPPLGERASEIPDLWRAFVAEACSRAEKRPLPTSDDAMGTLMKHAWPGNVRELRNTAERTVVLCASHEIRAEHIRFDQWSDGARAKAPAAPAQGRPPGELHREVRSLEREMIVRALDECAGNQRAAAERLQISRRTLMTRLDQFGLPRPRKGRGATEP